MLTLRESSARVSHLGFWRRVAWLSARLSVLLLAQVAVQAMAFAGGLFLIRMLSPQDYGYFTLAGSALGLMALLSDSGTGVGLSSIGGKVWQSPHRFGQLVRTTLEIRRHLAIPATLVGGPLLGYLLVSNGLAWEAAAQLVGLTLAALGLQILSDTGQAAIRLGGRIAQALAADLAFHALRLGLLVVASVLLLDVRVALGILVLCLAAKCLCLKRTLTLTLDLHAPTHPADRAALLGLAKRLAPNTIFYCIQGQITVWLAGWVAGVQTIAEVGALGRLGLAFATVQGVLTSAALPEFARCQSLTVLRRRYFQIVSTLVIASVAVVALAGLFPGQALWLLGDQYSHLEDAVVLAVALAVLQFLAGALWSLNAARGWAGLAWMHIPATIVLQVMLLAALEVSTVRGILLFGIFSTLPAFCINGLLSYRGFAAHSQRTLMADEA